TALSASGNALVTAGSIQVVGGVKLSGGAVLSPSHALAGAQYYLADPLAGLPVPTAGGARLALHLSRNSTLTINPGFYSSIKVSGNAGLTLNPGVYVLAGGGLTVTGSGSILGAGVLLYNAGSNYPSPGGSFGGLTLSGNGTIDLSPATTGVYAGVLIF